MHHHKVGGICLLLATLAAALQIGGLAYTPSDEATKDFFGDPSSGEADQAFSIAEDDFFDNSGYSETTESSSAIDAPKADTPVVESNSTEAGDKASDVVSTAEADILPVAESDESLEASQESNATSIAEGDESAKSASGQADASINAEVSTLTLNESDQGNASSAEAIMVTSANATDNTTANAGSNETAINETVINETAINATLANVSAENITSTNATLPINASENLTSESEVNATLLENATEENQTAIEPVAASASADETAVDEEIDFFDFDTYPTDRIWRDGVNDIPYTWTPISFSGFFYDLDDNVGTEMMTIDLDKSGQNYSRSVDSGALIYNSRIQQIKYAFEDWGKYEVLGFMAEKYFAGYKDNDVVDGDVSMINDNQLRRVLIDEDEDRTISTGSVLALEEGYELRIKEIDLDGNKVWLAVARDGDEVADKVITPISDNLRTSTFTYDVDISGKDAPLIMAHVRNVFSGAETSLVTLDGLFQISDTYDSVEEADKYGEMEVVSVSDKGIEMENEDSFTLRKGKTVNIMGNVGFLVADSDTLRFAPVVERKGSYEVRGTIVDSDVLKDYDNEFTWDVFNFEGFYYDIDDNVGTETLRAKVSGSSIKDGDLYYKTSPQSVDFELSSWGKYDVIGFMADKYFAGYNNGTTFTDEFSIINEGQLRKVLMDSDDERTLTSGSVLPLEEGYEVTIKEVDLNGNKVWLAVTQDGEEVGDKVLNPVGGDQKSKTFVYEDKIGTEEVPIIAVTVDSVFRGTEADLAVIKGIFQVSDIPEAVEEGDVHGKMKVESLSDSGIIMQSDGSISLGRGKEITIMGNLKFVVADDSDRRFCPVAVRKVSEEERLAPLRLEAPETIMGASVSITVTSDGKALGGALVIVDGSEIGTTSSDGTLRYTPDKAGTLQVQAKLEGYPDGSGSMLVRSMKEVRRLALNVPPEALKGETFLITVTGGLNLSPMEDVDVSFDDLFIGSTDTQGTVTYSSNVTGEHTVKASKEEHDDVSKNMKVVSSLDVTNLTLSEGPKAGKAFKVTATVDNRGPVADNLTYDLKVNGETVTSKDVVVEPGQSAEVAFEYTPTEPGVYKVEVGGRGQTVTVAEADKLNWMLIGLILILLIAIGAGAYLYKTGELEGLKEKLQNR